MGTYTLCSKFERVRKPADAAVS